MSESGINIEDFYAHATKHDFARLHQLRIIEWKWFGKDVLPSYDWHIYLETATLPSREIANLAVPYLGMMFNVPGMAAYSGASNYAVTFRCDKNYIIRRIVELQSRLTHNDTDTTGNYIVPGEDSYMVIGLLDKMQNFIAVYKLIGIHVINTGTISYNLGDTGTIAKVDATLAYHYWVYEEDKQQTSYEDEYDTPSVYDYAAYNNANTNAINRTRDDGSKTQANAEAMTRQSNRTAAELKKQAEKNAARNFQRLGKYENKNNTLQDRTKTAGEKIQQTAQRAANGFTRQTQQLIKQAQQRADQNARTLGQHNGNNEQLRSSLGG